jgi:flagellar protein FlaJ
MKAKSQIILFSAILCSVLAAIAMFISVKIIKLPLNSAIEFAVLAVLAAITPYSIYTSKRLKKIRMMDDMLPNFINDIAESCSAGMSIVNAIKTSAKGRYGALSAEIKRMSNQLSWDMDIEYVLKQFARRVNTPLAHRVVTLIIEGFRAGGNVVDVLKAAAQDASELKLIEKERILHMKLYVAVIYIAYFVFLAVIAVLAVFFIPALSEITYPQGMGGAAPEVWLPPAVDVNSIFYAYYFAIIIQGFGCGFTAGMLVERNIVFGIKHSFIMIIAGLALLKTVAI